MTLFSKKYPELRLVWDATCLNQFMRDPLVYYWKYVLGYREKHKSLALEWGTAWDKAAADYHFNRSDIENRDEALCVTIDNAINHCHKAGIDELAKYDKAGNKKNTQTLVRALVWFDKWIGDYDRYKPLISIPTTQIQSLDIKAPCGSDYILVGNFDQVAESFDGTKVVVERKTTTQTISSYFWLDYDPSVQTNTYDMMAANLFGTSGVIMEGLQTAVGFSRFDHHYVGRTNLQRKHWLKCIKHQIRLAEAHAQAGDWSSAMNPATQRWDNFHRSLQRLSPVTWETELKLNCEKAEVWNPLKID